MNLKEYVAGRLAGITPLEKNDILGLLALPPTDDMGDLAFPCFALAKTFRKAPPMIAAELAASYAPDEWVEKAEAVGGYLNFYFKREAVAKFVISDVLSKGKAYGTDTLGENKTVLVEYSSPNIAKPFHVGHLYSTAVGNALANIYEALGYNVQRLNHLGDWGTQFGKLICAYKRWGDKETIEKDPINELLKIYVRFHNEAEENPALEDEARHYFKLLEEGDEEATALWTWFREVSLREFKSTYDRLGIAFDSYNGEAFYGDKMAAVVDELKEKDLLVESEGAQIVDLSDEGLPPCLLLKSDGATIYATRDVTAALYRKQHYDFYKNIYVVGLPQSLHFKQIFAVLKKMGYDCADDCVHVGFGTVKLSDGKLSTRGGKVVLLEDVLKESVARTEAKIREAGIVTEDVEEISEKIGVGAVLYAFLHNSREKDIVFSWEDMLDFEGESAPYVQYSYARGKSILRRAEESGKLPESFCVTDEEYALIKALDGLNAAIRDSAEKNEPFVVNRYVTNLARCFNKFYNTSSILKEEGDVRAFRLALCEAACIGIQNALGLLGIQTVEQM